MRQIDYDAIQKRLDARKEIAEILSSQIHPWEVGYDNRSAWSKVNHDLSVIRDLVKFDGVIRSNLLVGLHLPISWKKMNPLVLFTSLVRCELSIPPNSLHGKLCSKCEALRAMRRKAPKRVLPEE